MMLRIGAFVFLLILVLYAPFWLYAFLILTGMVYFSVFWEGALLFLLSDALYAVPEVRFFGVVFVSFFASVFLLILVEFLKKKTKFYV